MCVLFFGFFIGGNVMLFGSVVKVVSQRLKSCPLFREPMILEPTDGSRTLVRSSDIFPGGIDSEFKGLDSMSGERTERAGFFLCDQPQGIECDCMPNLLWESRPVGTQHQVADFAELYFRGFYEEQGKEIWFPFRHAKQLFVAGMYMTRGHSAIRLIPLSPKVKSKHVLDGYHRVVILRP